MKWYPAKAWVVATSQKKWLTKVLPVSSLSENATAQFRCCLSNSEHAACIMAYLVIRTGTKLEKEAYYTLPIWHRVLPRTQESETLRFDCRIDLDLSFRFWQMNEILGLQSL